MNTRNSQNLKKTSILILINSLDFLLSHRKELILRYSSEFDECTVIFGTASPESIDSFKRFGINLKHSRFLKNKVKLLDLLYFFRILLFIKTLKPQVVQSITIKAILAHAAIVNIFPIRLNIFAFAGLGRLFNTARRKKFHYAFALKLLQSSLRDLDGAIVTQNNADLRLLRRFLVGSRFEYIKTMGSGIRTADYEIYQNKSQKPIPTMLFASRLLMEKGVNLYIGASSVLKKNGYEFKALIAGKIDRNDAEYISIEEIEAAEQNRYCEYLGEIDNLHAIWKSIDILVLPSKYNEGVPKVILEALAAKCVVVASNRACMREILVDGENSILVDEPYQENLSEHLALLIEDLDQRQKLTNFQLDSFELDVQDVVNAHMKLIGKQSVEEP